MRRPPDPIGEFEELRGILLSRETQELRDLRERLADREQRSRDISAVLPEAVKLSRERGDELTHALRPAIENAIRDSVQKNRRTFVEAFHPVIGPMVRRAVSQSVRRMMLSLNQTLDHIFSWQGLRWRFEAARSGRSFAEIVMLRSLVYRVEQVFLIHRQTGMSLLHVAADPTIAQDREMVARMLSAIQDFARDSFEIGDESSLDEFRLGELQVWIAPGPYAYLAAVIRGEPPRELRTVLENTIESIHTLNGSALSKFRGNSTVFEPLRPDLEACLLSQFDLSHREKRRRTKALFALLVLGALAAAILTLFIRHEIRWKQFLAALNREPGIVVTHGERGWVLDSQVDGLRDPSSPDPATIAASAGLDPKKIEFHWKDYLALDSANVRERFEQRFGLPANTHLDVRDGVVTVTGSPPYEWLEVVRNEATLVPGVKQLIDRDAQIAYDPAAVMKRFEAKFGLPDAVNVSFNNGALTLSGEASHRWMERVRSDANKIPGISAVEEKDLVDLDRKNFQEAKSAIESTFVYFPMNREDIQPDGFATLARLPEDVRRCQAAAKRAGENFSVEIDGYADAAAERTKNLELSQRRAGKVRDFFVSCGLDEKILKPIGKGAPLKTTLGSMLAAEQSDRCVGFKVLTEADAQK